MAAAKIKSNAYAVNLHRSQSEGTLIDLDDSVTINNNSLHGSYANQIGNISEWSVLPKESENQKRTTNPFWNQLSRSNPFLNDIVQTSTYDSGVSMLKEDPITLSDNNDDSVSTSSDETNFANLIAPRQSDLNRSGRWRSASDILDTLEKRESQKEQRLGSQGPFLNPDFEWLKNDREAYKMAWLSHRQLTRSCLDLSLMKQSPGWAQTQATDIQTICKIDHHGGSVQLPETDITAHIAQGHVAPGEVQEIGLKVLHDPPAGINNNYTTTLSPLLEVTLSNLDVSGGISLEMRMAAKVKNDPTSHVMTSFVGLVSQRKEGPYQRLKDCYVYNDMLQMKLLDLKPHMYVISAAEASILEPPARSIWDYLDRYFTVAIYGPKHIHPSLKVVLVMTCHNNIPPRLSFSDIHRGNRNLPPVVLELWGKHQLNPHGLKDLHIVSKVLDTNFEVKLVDQNKVVKQEQLKSGRELHLPLELVKVGRGEMTPFKLCIDVRDAERLALGDFHVTSPEHTPLRSDKHGQRRSDLQREVARSMPIPEESIPEILTQKFPDRHVDLQWYGVAMKSILRQPKVEYLLEYFKGDTVALLSRESVRSVGHQKVKEWYIGFIRGRIGLVHCKNLKVISKEQVIDFTGIKLTTHVLLDNMTIPFKKLTYMYSAIQTLVTEHVKCWRTFAEALGYSELSLDAISRRHAETEAEKVACVLEKLKEDCHAEKIKKKFQHELISGLLKMDAQGLVAHLIQDIVILSTAVELGVRWRELAERLKKLSNAQIAAYEAPHRGKNGDVSAQSMWKPAYDFLYAWSKQYGDGYRDMIQDLHLALDKMKSPVTKQWRQITGALITVNCMETLLASAFHID
ncbi:Metastasis-associated in colon cancer protein 1 SH3 domain-containing protein 7a5 [Triplophysa tibetana]|uniref:Metastasis-associated in colon cancer protein 1 SH3 domain-containing protein 7a5 n=1 Tax=Triplophysa tibetana TaxID=1572043 RepID=A0A5A9N287_9TELE|nr:Metastasis-associated in colon cancer protein 1 SH3 domain-containing protein 7a5 [Triplophysa tibetana]